MILKKTERLEDLQCGGLNIIQDKELYTFSSDSVVLANFVKTKAKDVAVEIGAGSGVVSILVQAKNKLGHIFSFEIQPCMAELCERNIALNNLQEKITLGGDDVKNFKKYIRPASVDVVFSNPPFFKETNFKQSEVKKIAKEDACLKVETLAEVASKMLKEGGNFFCVYCAERAIELACELQKNRLIVKELFFTENGKGEINLVVVKAVKGGKQGVKILPNLVRNDADGKYLETLHTKHFCEDS